VKTSIAEKKPIPDSAFFLKRTTLEFLQILFGERKCGDLHYDEDESKTDIQIADQHSVDLATAGTRPMIVAQRGPLSWTQMGLGGNSFVGGGMGVNGSKSYSDLLTGSMAFSCISREGMEAEQIAGLVFNAFKYFSEPLRAYGFTSIKSLNVGAESLIITEGTHDDLYSVPVYVTAQIQESWSINKTDLQKLRKLIIETQISP
jgi:hypothetical protein